MRRFRKKYETQTSYDVVKLKEQQQLARRYGLASKRELYIFKTQVRNIKRSLRIYGPSHRCTLKILDRLRTYRILDNTGPETYYKTIMEQLNVEHLLNSRLQTMVCNLGYKVNQSRQKIVHGKVKVHINGVAKVIRRPNLLIKKDWTIEIR